MPRVISFVLVCLIVNGSALAASPQWIWHNSQPKTQTIWLHKTFKYPGKGKAVLTFTCDNGATVYLNGKKIGSSSEWQSPNRVDVSKVLKPGENRLAVEATNEGNQGGFVAELKVGKKAVLVTDKSWVASLKKDPTFNSAQFKPTGWTAVRSFGAMGVEPWKNVFGAAVAKGGKSPAGAAGPQGNPYPMPSVIKQGFKFEHIYTVSKKHQGSWVSMTVDDKGRLIACDQGKKGVWRLTPPPIGKSEPVKVEKLNIPVTGSMGMLWAFDSLFFTRGGLHRVVDSDNDGEVDKVVTLRKFRGGGEHGPHAIVPSPDGKSLYFIAGNSTKMTPHESSLAPKAWKEDQLLPRQWDARGHARGRLAPGGWIARIDPEGKHCQIVAMGFRNPYDMDFNHDGALFAYDADMEWDSGTPWYRPTRLSHVTSGSDSGWRSGTGKFPPYYPDTIPATIDIGPGSPTGVVSGRGAKFPAKYQKALFLNDWTFGTIHAVHLTPSGSTYTATKEEFIAGKPLPLTDIVINPKDG
ncbi:MAG: hypothetical protein R3236_05835, partial [Phycisphaeraceae bacterium]|nr:hypothetical protein [Phycisphaeraceae bacterium]